MIPSDRRRFIRTRPHAAEQLRSILLWVLSLGDVDWLRAHPGHRLALRAAADDRRQAAQDKIDVGDGLLADVEGAPRAWRRCGGRRAAFRRGCAPGRPARPAHSGKTSVAARKRPARTRSTRAGKSTTAARLITRNTEPGWIRSSLARSRKPSFSAVTPAKTQMTRAVRSRASRPTGRAPAFAIGVVRGPRVVDQHLAAEGREQGVERAARGRRSRSARRSSRRTEGAGVALRARSVSVPARMARSAAEMPRARSIAMARARSPRRRRRTPSRARARGCRGKSRSRSRCYRRSWSRR